MSTPVISQPVAAGVLARLIAERDRRTRAREMSEELSKSFRKFVPAAWPVVEPSHPFKPAWHIDAIADHLQAVADGQIQNLLINISPGSAKSLICSVMYPAWMWAKDPGWRSMHASYEATLSGRDSMRCRDLLKSIWFQETFQPTWKFATDQDQKTYFYNTEKGFRISTSVGGRSSGFRAHHLSIDDPINVTDQFSDAVLEACLAWYDGSFYNRLADMLKGTRLLIMQRVGDRDLSGHLLRRGGWQHLCIPMKYDPSRSMVTCIGWSDPRTKRDELMCPQIFPQSVVDDTQKTLGESGFSGQYQQIPAPDGGGILKSHLWNYWQPPGSNLPPVKVKMPDGTLIDKAAIELPDSFDMELQGWDLAFKDLKTSDYVVGMQVGVRGSRRFVRDMMRGKMDLPASISAIREMSGRYPKAHLKLIEDKANGPAVIQSLRNELTGLVEVNPEGSKVGRASSVTPELEAGNWYLPHPKVYPWVGDPANPTSGGFLAESVMFPFGANDDQVDALSMICVRLQKEQIGGVFGVSESDIRVDPFDLRLIEKWPKVYGFSVNLHAIKPEVAAVWLCRQPETSQHYMYAEYIAPAGDAAQHAVAIRLRGDQYGYMTSKDVGRDIKDGYAIARKYTNLGLKLETIQNNEDAAVIDLAEALRSGKLKIFGNLGSFWNEFRLFRRENGKLPTYNRGVIDAAMVAWRVRDKMRAPLDPNKRDSQRVSPIDISSHGWMSG